MKTIEEEIWDYIDGSLDEQERHATAQRIETDAAYAQVYTEMMDLHQLMADAELEEPSMGFTNLVMDQVRPEPAPVALKTKTDPRIIYSLSGIFIAAIVFVAIYAVRSSTWSLGEIEWPQWKLNLDLQIHPAFIQAFLFVDILLALVCLDRYIRPKKQSRQESA